jgi:uncharacterized membrane protein
VLLLSLAVNLAVVGLAAGFSMSYRYAALADGAGGPVNLARFADQLPGDRRGEVRRLVSAERPRLMPLRRALQQARRDAARALQAEPFDKDAFQAAQVAVIEADVRLRRETAVLIATVAATLTPAERRQFISLRNLQQMRGKGPRGGPLPDELDPPPLKDGQPPR